MTPEDFRIYVDTRGFIDAYGQAYERRLRQPTYFSFSETRKMLPKSEKNYLFISFDGTYHNISCTTNATRRLREIDRKLDKPVMILDVVPLLFAEIAEQFLFRRYERHHHQYKSFLFRDETIHPVLYDLFMLKQFAFEYDQHQRNPSYDWGDYFEQLG